MSDDPAEYASRADWAKLNLFDAALALRMSHNGGCDPLPEADAVEIRAALVERLATWRPSWPARERADAAVKAFVEAVLVEIAPPKPDVESLDAHFDTVLNALGQGKGTGGLMVGDVHAAYLLQRLKTPERDPDTTGLRPSAVVELGTLLAQPGLVGRPECLGFARDLLQWLRLGGPSTPFEAEEKLRTRGRPELIGRCGATDDSGHHVCERERGHPGFCRDGEFHWGER